MLAIRMQRTGRKGHAQFRMVVQDSRRTPSSGNIVAALGSYNPHTKVAKLDTEKAAVYLNNGAQPSDRATALLQKEGVKMPSWVVQRANKAGIIRNADKLRRNQPKEETAEVEAIVEEITEVEAISEEISESAEEPSTKA